MRFRHTPLLLALTLLSTPVLASDVPGAGVDRFLQQLALVWGGLGLAGLVAGVGSAYLRRTVVVCLLPPLCALVWMYFASHGYARHGDMGVVLVGWGPYALCYWLARLIARAIRARGHEVDVSKAAAPMQNEP